MRFNYLIAVTALGAVALGACSSGSHSAGAANHPRAVPVAITTSGLAVQRGDTSLGAVLVSSSGHTVYGLMNDTKTNSTCGGACAQVWPPLLVDKGWTAAPGLDRSQFSTIVRKDGTRQLVAGRWPLYTYSGDAKAGDVNGEGSGGVWFAVGTNGALVKDATASGPVTTASSGY